MSARHTSPKRSGMFGMHEGASLGQIERGQGTGHAPEPLPWMSSFQARVYRHRAFRGRIALPLRADPDACWRWTAGHVRAGYGRVRVGHQTWYAHRLSRFVAFGDLPEAACHSCDNPPCVNPEHLRAGTRSDNTAEMWAKGRQGVFAKLTPEAAAVIRARFVRGNRAVAALGAEFGVSGRTVYRLLANQTIAYREVRERAA